MNVPNPIEDSRAKPNRQLSRQDAGEIKWLANNSSISYKEIAEFYRTTKSNAHHIGCGYSWKNVIPRKPVWYYPGCQNDMDMFGAIKIEYGR